MKMRKRLLSAALALCLLLTLLPVGAAAEEPTPEETTAPATEDTLAEEPRDPGEDPVLELAATVTIPEGGVSGQCGDSLTWTLTEDGTLTITGSGAMWDYDHDVSFTPWYTYRTRISQLVLDDRITHIGSYAFYMLYRDCTDVYKKDSLPLPAGLKSVGDYAFYEVRKVENLTIPDGVESIGSYAFAYICVHTGFSNGTTGSISDIYGTLTMPGKWPALGEGAFYYNNFTGALHIPEGVESIPAKAFNITKFTTLTLPESIRYIGDYALADLDITELKLPARQPDMGQNVFAGCDYISELVIPDAWTSIPYGMCRNWSRLASVILPAGLKEIGDNAFYYCSALTSIIFPVGLERIGEYAFSRSGLQDVTLPAGLKSLGQAAFQSCTGLTAQPAWPAGLEEVGGYIYAFCSNLTGIGTFPSGIGYSGAGLFESTAITSATLAADMTSVPSRSFCTCKSLTKVYVPSSVTTIYGLGFYTENVSIYVPLKLKSIYYEGTREDWDKIEYEDVPYGDSSNSQKIVNRVIDAGGLHCLGIKRPEVTEKPVYKSTTGERLIRIMVPGSTSYPQPSGFTVQTDKGTFSTGSKNLISVELEKTNPGSITISRENYHSYTLPEELVGSASNIISMYRTDWEGPFAQSILLIKSSERFNASSNLLFESAVFHMDDKAGSARSLYVDVNWNGLPEGKIYLWQSCGRRVDLHQGLNTGLNLSGTLRTDQPVYLAMETGGQRYTQETRLSILDKRVLFDVNLGEAITTAKIPEINPWTNENVDVFGGETLKLDFKKLMDGKIPISIEVESDGTIKGTIGIKLGKTSEKGASYETIKEAIQELKTADASLIPGSTKLSKLLADNAKKGNIPEASAASVGVSGEVQLLGYVEGFHNFETGETKFTEIGCGLAFKGSASYTQTYLLGATPMYFTVGVKGALEQSIEMFKEKTHNVFLPGDETMKITFSISLENGVGYPDVLNVGINGSGKLKIVEDLPHEDDQGIWTLTASASINVGAAGFSSTIPLWNSDSLILYKDGVILPGDSAASLSLQSLKDLEWTKVSQDYRKEPSVFAINDRVALQDVTTGTITDDLFKSNVYPYAEPLLVTQTQSKYYMDDTFAFWLDAGDNGRVVLYYSFYDYSKNWWTAPQPVDSNNQTGSDFAPTAWMDEYGNLFLAWCRTPGGSSLEDAADGLDICCAVFPYNYGTPSMIQVVCQLDGTDMLPAIGMADGKLRAAWVHSPDGIFAASGQQICTADADIVMDSDKVKSVAWGEPTLAAGGLGNVDGLVLDTAGSIWFSQDRDGSGARALYRLEDGVPVLAAENACKPSVHNGGVWYYNTAAGTVDSVQGGSFPAVAGSDWYRWMEKSDTLLVRGHDENGASVFYASYRGTPLTKLASIEDCISGIGAAERSDGSIVILTNLQTLNASGTPTKGDLMLYQVTAGAAASFSDLSYDPETLVSGGLLSASVNVENRGSETLKYFHIQSDTEDLYVAMELGCGESGTLSFDLTLPEVPPESMSVTITPCSDSATDGAASSLVLPLRLADVSLEEMYVQPGENGGVETTLRVVNRGQTTLSGITVSLHADAADGALAADSQTVDTLEPGDVATLTFLTPAAQIGETGLLYATAVLADDSLAENFRANNTAFARLTGESVIKDNCTVYTSARREGSSVEVTVGVENFSGTPYSGAYYAAVYKNGRMVAIHATEAQTVAAGGMANVLSCILPVPDGDLEVKVFTLDGANCPAAAVWSCQLEAE